MHTAGGLFRLLLSIINHAHCHVGQRMPSHLTVDASAARVHYQHIVRRDAHGCCGYAAPCLGWHASCIHLALLLQRQRLWCSGPIVLTNRHRPDHPQPGPYRPGHYIRVRIDVPELAVGGHQLLPYTGQHSTDPQSARVPPKLLSRRQHHPVAQPNVHIQHDCHSRHRGHQPACQ